RQALRSDERIRGASTALDRRTHLMLGSTAAEGLQRIGRTSIATRWRFCGLPQSASCSENFVIPPDVFGQTLSSTFSTNWIGRCFLQSKLTCARRLLFEALMSSGLVIRSMGFKRTRSGSVGKSRKTFVFPTSASIFFRKAVLVDKYSSYTLVAFLK